jgi:hypothetical protein
MTSLALILKVLAAIAVVESNTNDQAVGALGERGRYQMTQQALTEVNEVTDAHFVHRQLSDPAVARSAAVEYMLIVSLNMPRNVNKAEWLARCWNGGPTGYYKRSTAAYWLKVKAEMTRQEAEARISKASRSPVFKLPPLEQKLHSPQLTK